MEKAAKTSAYTNQPNQWPKYPAYKDSGVEWLGEVPEHWKIMRIGSFLKERRKKVSDKDFAPLSVTKQGILPQLDAAAKTNDGDNRKLVVKGDFVINSRSDRKGSSGISDNDGSVSLINIVLELIGIDNSFCSHLLKSYAFVEEFYRNGHGIVADLWTTRYDDMRSIMCALPSKKEQTRIAAFLDKKLAQIDQAIAQKERMIQLLKERQQIMVHKAVTQGLNPDVPMKASGVEWIGEIPEHWEVLKAKFIFDEKDERSKDGQEELLSVSHLTGVTPRAEKNVNMFLAEDYSGSKVCESGDLVINIMWAWMGALGVSKQKGIVSPSYGVFRQKGSAKFTSWFLEKLLRDNEYVAEYNRRSTGLHSSRLRLYADYFFAMELGVPPYEEQQKIEKKVSSVNQKLDLVLESNERQIQKLKEYKATLIDAAVTGKIKV